MGCYYTAKFRNLRRVRPEADVWGDPTPIKLEGGSVRWTIRQGKDGSPYTYKKSLRKPLATDGLRVFEIERGRSHIAAILVTVAVSVSDEKFASGEFDTQDVASFNATAKAALDFKHRTPDSVQNQ